METRGKRGSRGTEPNELPAETATALGQAVELPKAAVELPEVAIEPAAAADIAPAAAAEIAPAPAAENAPAPAAEATRRAYQPAHPDHQAFSALAESRAAIARGLDAISDELAGLARTEIAAAAGAVSGLLEARTLSEAVAVNLLFARRSLGALLAGSAKISELAVKSAAESAEAVTPPLSAGWIRAVSAGG